MPCFSRASQGIVEAEASKLHSTSKKNLLLFYRDLYVVPAITLPATCVPEPSHSLCSVKSLEPTPKQRCKIQLSSPPYTSQGNSLPATREPLSLLVVKPGVHHKLIKQAEFTVRRETRSFPRNEQITAPQLLARQFSLHGLGRFQRVKRFLSSVPLERKATALTR